MSSFITTFAALAPIFALAALGFLVAKTGIISRAASSGLSEFVNVLAIPALLFRAVTEAKTPDVNPFPYWASYFIALFTVWFIADTFARRSGRQGREAAIAGFASAQSNTVMVGLPVILSTVGEAGKLPIVILLAVHLSITMTGVSVLIARGEGGGWGALLKGLVTNSIFLAIIAGLAFRFSGWPMPKVATDLLRMIGDTATPCALVAMGMSLTAISFGGARLMIVIITLLKLILHPALVYVLAVYVFRLPPAYAASAVIFAACPTGIQAYLIAERFKAGAVVASG
ncbi:MAG: AEC family transporter, partial [Proteobacteria bacterium]|nr:AEC family transporter [Pseudomonadota bacterium]